MKKLRIFYGFDLYLGSAFNIAGKDTWTANIYDTLKSMGHDLVAFDYNLGEFFHNLEKKIPSHIQYANKHKKEVVEAFLQQIKAAHQKQPIDILLSYFYDNFMTADAIKEVKKLGILTVNYNCNASYQLDLISDVSPAFDYCLTVETFRMDDYKKLGANPIYFQEAANPNYYKPYNFNKIYDCLFIGQCYGDRGDYIKYLLDNDIDIKVFGLGWQKVIGNINNRFRNLRYHLLGKKKRVKTLLSKSIIGQKLEFSEMIKVYSRAKIAVNFATCGDTHLTGNRITQIRLRDFEAPMCGVLYITEYTEELEEFYKIDQEIICYKTKEELADKIKFYLKNDSLREKISKAGRERALKDHSWENRFLELFRQIDIN